MIRPLIPEIALGMGSVIDGTNQCAPLHCKKMKDRCVEFYENLQKDHSEHNKIVICPYGFNSYYHSNLDILYSCIRVLNKYQKRADNKIDRKDNRNQVIAEEYFRELLNESISIRAMEQQNKFVKNVVNSFVHEATNFNKQTQEKTETLSSFKEKIDKQRKSEYQNHLHRLRSINELMNVKIRTLSYSLSKNEPYASTKYDYGLYERFDKAVNCFNDRKNGINISLYSNRHINKIKSTIDIEILPAILLDNAIKYNPKSEKLIKIDFNDHLTKLEVSIESIGPLVGEDEIDLLFTHGYRAQSAIESKVDGSGLGLHILKEICRHNDIAVKAFSDKSQIEVIRDMEYAPFRIELTYNWS